MFEDRFGLNQGCERSEIAMHIVHQREALMTTTIGLLTYYIG